MVTSALILDCDGVLADTELHGHLVAFNQTFEEFGLPVRWSVDDYRRKVLIGGGKERLASLLTPELVAAAGLPADPEEQQAAVAAWHRRKTEIYLDLVARGAVPPRPGVARLVGEALAAGWTVAVASTSAAPSVRATLARAVGTDTARQVTVFAGDVVPAKKPAPDIYLLALHTLGVPAGRAIVVEDSRNGLLAAVGAGLTCLVTVNQMRGGEDFAEGGIVVSSLGDPDNGGEPAGLIANHSPAPPPGDQITLAALAGLLSAAGGTGGTGLSRSCGRGGRRAPHPRPRRGERGVLRPPGRGRGRRRLRLLDGPRLRAGARGLGRLRPDRYRHLPQEGRDHDHQPHRGHLGPDLGHRLPPRGHHRRRRDDARRRSDRRHAAGVDRRDQGPRQVRPRRQDAA